MYGRKYVSERGLIYSFHKLLLQKMFIELNFY